MGQFEDIMDAIEPLYGRYSHAQVDFNIKTRRVCIILKLAGYSIWDIHFCQDSEEKLSVYFFFDRNADFMRNRDDLDLSGFQVFSGLNVFQYLGIPYPSKHEGFIPDLHTMAMLISENFNKFAKAVIDERIEKTFFTLKAMRGNNEKEIREVIKPIYNRIR